MERIDITNVKSDSKFGNSSVDMKGEFYRLIDNKTGECVSFGNIKTDEDKEKQKMKLISVEEYLPKAYEKVLAKTDSKVYSEYIVAYRGRKHGGVFYWYACGVGNKCIDGYMNITHWAALPKEF